LYSDMRLLATGHPANRHSDVSRRRQRIFCCLSSSLLLLSSSSSSF